MEKKRVNKGEEYWYLTGVCNVEKGWDNYDFIANLDFINNNYFCTKEEAEAMAKKIKAVLNGADVIQMPSEEDCETFAAELAQEKAFVGKTFSTRREWRMASRMTFDWLKSKIVK